MCYPMNSKCPSCKEEITPDLLIELNITRLVQKFNCSRCEEILIIMDISSVGELDIITEEEFEKLIVEVSYIHSDINIKDELNDLAELNTEDYIDNNWLL